MEQELLRGAVPLQNLSGAIVAVDVGSARQRALRAAVYIAAGDRAAATRVGVVEDRKDIGLRVAAKRGVVVRAGGTLEHAPAVVAAVDDRHVHFLARVLTDVGHPLHAGEAIEAEAPWVAHAVRKNLAP